MTEAGGEQLQATNGFPERTPSNSAEEKLIILQQQADTWGLQLFKDLIFDVTGDQEAAMNLLSLAEEAGELLDNLSLDYLEDAEKGGFSARYLYDKRREASAGALSGFLRLVYPVDSMYYLAYIQGEVGAVKPIVAQHPAMDRDKGPFGYRLCAEVDATRMMGWSSETPEKFYVPVGEILLKKSSYQQGTAEALRPNP